MKSATGKLLSDRGDLARLVYVQRKIEADAKMQACIENSLCFTHRNLDAMAVFGWCSGDFVEGCGTALIPHCWVRDGTGTHIDITPLATNARDRFEYVSDDRVYDLFLEHKIWLLPPRLTPAHTYQVRVAPDQYIDIHNVDLYTLREETSRSLELI